jgi:hypothetical protein
VTTTISLIARQKGKEPKKLDEFPELSGQFTSIVGCDRLRVLVKFQGKNAREPIQ